MPSYPHIDRYYEEKQRFIDYGGSDNEQNIRRAFALCLDSYCRDHREKLALVDELEAPLRNRPDGTVRDSLRMTRGYWEAKDSHDDLDAEIQAKFNRGYPRDNIVFEDSLSAVLFQNGEQAMRADMSRPADLHRLIRVFLDYELPEIEEFRQAQQQFKADLPAVLENLRQAVADAEANNAHYQDGAARFLAHCRQTISPSVSGEDVRYRLGSRSALEWVLDQYKERKPRDPTIAAKFNSYRFADHKERVIDLLQRVCTVSVRTMEIIEEMPDGSDTGAGPAGSALLSGSSSLGKVANHR